MNEPIIKVSNEKEDLIDLIDEKILKSYLFNVVCDWKNIPTAIKCTFVCFCKSQQALPMWDGTTSGKDKTSSTNKK